MGLGDLTKQLAKEAFSAQVEEVIGSPRGPEPPGAPEPLASVIMSQVQAMQNALKDDHELLVLCTAGKETVRVFEMFSPSPRLLVLTGIDAERSLTRVISAADGVQLVCKPIPVKDGAKAVRLRFMTPKAKGG
ncbi:MAG: hypothetical protein KIT09_15430 [Bryobacteraceae bacterium]|nr:hypothetical protein [Bryobacteraceae bacterium]